MLLFPLKKKHSLLLLLYFIQVHISWLLSSVNFHFTFFSTPLEFSSLNNCGTEDKTIFPDEVQKPSSRMFCHSRTLNPHLGLQYPGVYREHNHICGILRTWHQIHFLELMMHPTIPHKVFLDFLDWNLESIFRSNRSSFLGLAWFDIFWILSSLPSFQGSYYITNSPKSKFEFSNTRQSFSTLA